MKMEDRPGFCRAVAVSAQSTDSQALGQPLVTSVKVYPQPKIPVDLDKSTLYEWVKFISMHAKMAHSDVTYSYWHTLILSGASNSKLPHIPEDAIQGVQITFIWVSKSLCPSYIKQQQQ